MSGNLTLAVHDNYAIFLTSGYGAVRLARLHGV